MIQNLVYYSSIAVKGIFAGLMVDVGVTSLTGNADVGSWSGAVALVLTYVLIGSRDKRHKKQ